MTEPDQTHNEAKHLFLDQEKMKFYFRLREVALAEYNKSGTEFSELEVKIACTLLGFSAAGSLVNGTYAKFPLQVVILIVIAWAFLIISLFVGLLTSHLKQRFFERDVEKFTTLKDVWTLYFEGKESRENAKALIDLFKKNYPKKSPEWTWITQTIFLALGTFNLFIALGLFLFFK